MAKRILTGSTADSGDKNIRLSKAENLINKVLEECYGFSILKIDGNRIKMISQAVPGYSDDVAFIPDGSPVFYSVRGIDSVTMTSYLRENGDKVIQITTKGQRGCEYHDTRKSVIDEVVRKSNQLCLVASGKNQESGVKPVKKRVKSARRSGK